jgi:dipeptidyl aminopeptidase/acylaminoacyl peptidase
MNTNDRLERHLPTILESLAPAHTPAYLHDIIREVDHTRQRPRWTFPERWLPVSVLTNRLAVAPRIPLRAVLAVTLLILALVVGAVLLAGSRQRVPLPFGPAANGQIAYADTDGAIRGGQAGNAPAPVLVSGPGNERPVFSPDGTRLAFLRADALGNLDILVVGADGGAPKVLTSDALLSIGHLGWAPDSRSVVAVVAGSIHVFDVDGTLPPRVLNEQVGIGGSVSDLDEFNAELGDLFRPPDGDEILYIGNGPEGAGLYRQPLAGGDPIGLLTTEDSPIPFADLSSAQWSPDGDYVTVAASERMDGSGGRLYVMNADGTDLRRLSTFESPVGLVHEEHAAWSPDGTQIAFLRWINSQDGTDVRPVTIVDVASGDEREVGDVNVNGYAGWGWSPDGRSIVEVPSEPSPDANRVLLVDARTGAVTRTGWAAESAASWQRVAP